MCRSCKTSQSAVASNVPNVQPNVGGGVPGGPGTPGPDPEANTPAALLGAPDYAPQYTFIAQATPTDNGFINLAVQFHTNSGLSPITVSSIQEIVELLDDNTRTSSGILNRIRIVSHVFFDSTGLQQPINMMLPFLTGGIRPALKRHFAGYAISGIAGLKAMMTFEVTTFTNTTHFIYSDTAATLMGFLRPAHATILNKISTDAFGEPTGEFVDFFKICGSKWALARNAISNATQRATINQGYDLLLADIIPRISGTVTTAELNTLKDAIVALGNSQTLNFQTPHNSVEYAQNVQKSIDVMASFSTKLIRVKQRFNQNSKVDIRGCQVGRDPDFLSAIQSFFGVTASVRPSVSGPNWFQHFNAIGNITGLNSNANVELLHNSGFSPYSPPETLQFINDWCNAFGITDAHLTFWRQTFALNTLSFCSLGWKTNIPATRIPIVRLQSLTSDNFEPLIRRLATIFLVTAPNATAFADVQSALSNLTNWGSQLTAPVQDAANATQLTNHFNNYKSIYEGVDKRFTAGGGTPTAAQRIIPTVAPALTVQVVRDFQTALINFIDTHASSRFRPFKTFMNAALARAQDTPSKTRYFLCLGLPALVYNPAAPNAIVNSLIVYQDGAAVTERRQNEAIRYWIRAQWRGNIPATLGDNTTFQNSRQTPWLVENRQPGAALTLAPFVISPTNEFQAQIVTVNP